MKVAMVGLRGIPAKSGGVEVVVEHLAPLLVELGVEVTVYCRNPYCPLRPKEWRGVKLRYLPTINRKHTEAIAHTMLSTCDSIFRDYDIVHYHAMGNGLFSIIPRLIGKRTVVTLHGLDWEREKWGGLAKAYLKMSESAICRFPNKVISVSKKIQKYYKSKYSKDIAFIPNGVDIEEAKPISSLKRFGLAKGSYILFLSRIVPEKGVDYLIEAFKQIKTDKRLVIAGDATHTEDYLAMVKGMAAGDQRIIFTGGLYSADKAEAYSNAALFVLPSTIEGMPVVLLEAMSYGCCPIVSDIEENLDVLAGNGFSFKSKDSGDLKRQIEIVLKNPMEAKKKGVNAKALVARDYQWPKIAKQTLELYNAR